MKGASKFTFVIKQTVDYEVISNCEPFHDLNFSYKSTRYKKSHSDDNLFAGNNNNKCYLESSEDNDELTKLIII